MIDCFDGEYRFLSNFYPCEVVYEGTTYPTTEHAFQAAKTLDPEERKKMAAATTPGNAKRYGRRICLRKDWEEIKVSVMKEILIQKFSKPELRDMLLATGDEELVEGNTWNDTFWGVCKGYGGNHLGKILMEIRESIRKDL